MSKSLGNHISLLLTPEEMYGKIMSIPDSAMGAYFRLLTRWTPAEIAAIEQAMNDGSLHPKNAKMKLAYEIVSIYHSPEDAKHAQENFVEVFQKKHVPDEIKEYKLEGNQTVLEVLVDGGLVKSKSEGRRLIAQNGVKLDGEMLKDPNQEFPHTGVLKVGKRRFLKVVK